MAVMGWLAPALAIGASLYIGHKQKAGKVRWIAATEEEVKKLPVIAAVHKATPAEALPAPPLGHTWKEITLTYSVSPFTAPSEARIHVLERVSGMGTPTGAGSFLTAEYLSSFVSTQELIPAPELGYVHSLSGDNDLDGLGHSMDPEDAGMGRRFGTGHRFGPGWRHAGPPAFASAFGRRMRRSFLTDFAFDLGEGAGDEAFDGISGMLGLGDSLSPEEDYASQAELAGLGMDDTYLDGLSDEALDGILGDDRMKPFVSARKRILLHKKIRGKGWGRLHRKRWFQRQVMKGAPALDIKTQASSPAAAPGKVPPPWAPAWGHGRAPHSHKTHGHGPPPWAHAHGHGGMDGFMGDIADSTADAVAKLAPELRAQGLVLVRIPPGQAARGDFVVTRDCKLWTVDAEQAGRLILRGLGADKGASRTVSRGELECAFGVRRMG